ncbi:MAG: tetratricopeptide repeat protein [Actinomycetota bacterium]
MADATLADYYDLGAFTRPVTTTNDDAQAWFDLGLNWLYGFNHGEAIACFARAVAADPTCAMAHWGIAIAAGPNYNLSWDQMDGTSLAGALATAHAAAETAQANAAGVTEPEAALISALPARYPQSTPIDPDAQMAWNHAFTDAMRDVAKRHPDDLEIQATFVDAILNETPWKMWDVATGEPGPGAKTVEAQGTLERLFADHPDAWDHPGLLHQYVHLMEMSPTPEIALRHGDRLRELAPDCGHLIHMPTHLDVLCGHYHDVVHWNTKAAEADARWFDREGLFSVWTLYAIHNLHFVVYGAMFGGQYRAAADAAAALKERIPEAFLRIESPPFADAAEVFHAMEVHVKVRFGRWQELIDHPLPADPDLWFATTAITLYGKTLAHSALGQIDEAEAARERFVAAADRVPDSRRMHNNTVVDLLEVARAMVDGEVDYRRGAHDAAFAHLRRAVELEDALDYDEPWGWMQPTRHALGALLLEQGRIDEAEAVYRADLGLDLTLSRATQHPDNLWSLFGLHECLVARGAEAEAGAIRRRLDLASARADVPIAASCFCHQAALATVADANCCHDD